MHDDNAVVDRGICQVDAEFEHSIRHIGDAAGHHDAGQGCAADKRILPDAGDAAGNRDAGHAGVKTKRIRPDAGHQQTVNVGWDGHSSTRTGIFGDGDGVGIAGIYSIIEIIT